jgi:phosphoglycolate phosphatase
MVTARRASVTSIGVTWGFRGEKELRENYADHIVDSPSRILHLALEAKAGKELS